VSFEKHIQVDQLIEWMIANLQVKEQFVSKGKKITVIGKPNVGKSSLCNRFLKKDRLLVSDIAGTTVDSIETPF
jgi:GTP-binding protein